jgi:hypothetical protein
VEALLEEEALVEVLEEVLLVLAPLVVEVDALWVVLHLV